MTQPELPLEWADGQFDHYTIEIRKGPLHGEELIRSHEAKDTDAALNLIDGIRETYMQREGVAWTAEEVNPEGKLYGMAQGTVYIISVTPPLTVALS